MSDYTRITMIDGTYHTSAWSLNRLSNHINLHYNGRSIMMEVPEPAIYDAEHGLLATQRRSIINILQIRSLA